MAVYEFDHNGVRYPDVSLSDLRVLLEEEAQGFITNPWDELRVKVGKHASVQVITKVLFGTMSGDVLDQHVVLIRVDTDEVVDELEVPFPLPKTPADARRAIAEGVV